MALHAFIWLCVPGAGPGGSADRQEPSQTPVYASHFHAAGRACVSGSASAPVVLVESDNVATGNLARS